MNLLENCIVETTQEAIQNGKYSMRITHIPTGISVQKFKTVVGSRFALKRSIMLDLERQIAEKDKDHAK